MTRKWAYKEIDRDGKGKLHCDHEIKSNKHLFNFSLRGSIAAGVDEVGRQELFERDNYS